ncbi:MAG: tetratricopeptide repeat protein [Candidatus Rokuibacteriota bacterium]
MSVRQVLGGLPPALRWSALGLIGFLVAVAVGLAVWLFLDHRADAARQAFGSASAAYRRTMAAATPDEAALRGAAESLRQYVKDHPRSAQAGQAWYFLGNLEYQRRDFDAARAAFDEAIRRSPAGTLGTLARLGLGYAWEARGDPQQALAAYQGALDGRTAKDFLYPELLLATARTQEELKQTAAAIETYRRLLKDVPDLPRADEVRSRLALLGASA